MGRVQFVLLCLEYYTLKIISLLVYDTHESQFPLFALNLNFVLLFKIDVFSASQQAEILAWRLVVSTAL